MEIFAFATYVGAIALDFLLMLMLAMDTAFAGIDPRSAAYILPTLGEICSMVLLSIGAVALLGGKVIPSVLLLSGPVISLVLALTLALTSFQSSSLVFNFAELLGSSLALFAGIRVTQTSFGHGGGSAG